MDTADTVTNHAPVEQLLAQLSKAIEQLPEKERRLAALQVARLSEQFTTSQPVGPFDARLFHWDAGTLDRLIDQAPVGIAILDVQDYRISLANQAQLALWPGKSDPVGLTIAEIFPETLQQIQPILDRILATGEPFHAESVPFDIDKEDGQVKTGYYNVTYTPLYDPAGRINGLLALTQEVTTLVEARQQLEQEQARLEAILQALPVGLWITDRTGRMILKNRKGDEIWAGDAPLSENLSAYLEYPAFKPGSSAPLPLEERPMVRALTKGESVVNEELDIQRFDGTRGTILAGAAPVRDSHGELIGGVGVAQDITDRKQARLALQESEARFHTLADNISQLVWIADAQGNRTWYNQRWYDYTGTTPDEMLGMGWEKVHHPDHYKRIWKKYNRAIESGESWEDTFPLRGKDGQYRWFLMHAVPVRDETGQVVRWFGTNTDITEQLAVEDDLRRREEDLRLVMSATGVGMWEYDPQTGLGLSSPENAQIYGLLELGPDFLTTWQSHIHPEDLEKVWLGIQKCLDEGSADLEYRYLREGQDQYCWIYTRASLTSNSDGKLLMVGISLDISEQKQLRQLLEENEERLRLALEGARQGIWDWELQVDRLVWDEGCRKIFGLPESEPASYAWHIEHVHPGDRERVREAATVALRDHTIFVEDYRTIRPDGEMRWITSRGRGFYNADGQPYRMSGTVLDITELKLAEENLLLSEARLRLALNNAPITVFAQDNQLRYQWIYNQANIGPAVEVIGKRDDELLPQQDAAELVAVKQQVIDSGQALSQEVTFFVEGKDYHHLLALEPVLGESGQVLGLRGASVDVTEQRRLEAIQHEQQLQVEIQRRLLERRESERQDIARDIHDGPLQNLIATLYNLNLGKAVFREPQALLEFEQAERSLKDIIRELREITSYLRPPSLIHLGVDRAIKVHAVEFQEKNPHIRLDLDLPDEQIKLPELTGLALYRIFQEALTNVVRHSSASRVRVRLIFTTSQVMLEIQDNGKGFPMPKDLRAQTELGHFGMAGMSERAEAVGGKLLVASIPGKGTRLRVRIPLSDER